MTKPRGIVLYGPPASGKSSITKALTALDPEYRLYERLKVGGGRVQEYRMTENAHIRRLRDAGQILWENRQYGAIYAIERKHLANAIESHKPIVHIGQPAGVSALVRAHPGLFLVVALTCTRDIAAQRLVARDPEHLNLRLRVWDQTPALVSRDLLLDTSRLSRLQCARQIDALSDIL